MKVECMDCHKVYNFKDEKVPDKSFTFSCKACGGRIRISQEIIDAVKSQADAGPNKSNAKETKKKKNKGKKKGSIALPNIKADALKKPLGKIGGLISGMAANASNRSERDWMLTLTKGVVYFSMVALIMLLVVGGLAYFSVAGSRTVTYADVQRSLDLKLDPVMNVQAVIPDIKLPTAVKQHLNGDHRERFVDWMYRLDDSQKADFIENLEAIVRRAQKDDPEHVGYYIKEYGNLKIKQSVEKPYAQYIFKFGLIIAMIATMALLGLFTLVLIKIMALKPRSN
jgi:hypothetical protein